MKVFVATCLGQGRKAHDVCTTLEGEPVALPPFAEVCCLHQRTVTGMSSGGETTTFMVVDRPELYFGLYRGFVRDGWCRIGWKDNPVDPGEAWADELADNMLRVSEALPIGTVLERVDWRFESRLHPDWTSGPVV
jgi:hypothetical protein